MKLKEFQKELKKRKIDCCILANLKNKDENVFYFLQKEFEYCLLLILSKGKMKLFVPELGEARVRGIRVNKGFIRMKFLKKHLRKYKSIGINKAVLSLKEYSYLRKIKKAKYIDISRILENLRETKTKKEIKKIRKACKLTDKILWSCIKNFKKFKTEKEARSFLKKQSCELSFDPIVASGKNSAAPHHEASGKIRTGFCMIDFGVKNEGYCCDETRMVHVGRPSRKEIELYDFLLNTQKLIIKNLKPGVTISQINRLIKRSLGKYKKNMIHGFGHSLGIKVHDPYGYEDTKRFLENNVFTVEPGIYFKNKFGIRIEDSVLITRNGCDVMTKNPKKLVIMK